MRYECLGKFVSLSQGLVVNKSTTHLFSDTKNNEFVYPLLRIVDFEKGNHAQYSKYVNKNVPQKVVIDENAILFTRVTCQCFRGFSGVFHNNLFKVELTSNELNEDYLYVVLQSDFVRKQAMKLAESSVVPDLSHTMFKSIIIPVPNMKNQEKIADIFLKIQNKITNNTSICSDLESMAKLIYDYWFVQFDFPDENGKPYKSSGGKMVWNEELKREIPEGWKVKSLSDICSNITDGVHESVTNDNTGEYLLLSCQNIKYGNLDLENNIRKINQDTFSKIRSRTKLAKGDVLVSSVGTIGEVCLLNSEPKNFDFQRSVAILKPNLKIISSEWLYQMLLSFKSLLQKRAHGAVQKCVFISDFSDIMVILPQKRVIDDYSFKVQSLFKKKTMLIEENQQLASLRDFLLPMLMNGQVKIQK